MSEDSVKRLLILLIEQLIEEERAVLFALITNGFNRKNAVNWALGAHSKRKHYDAYIGALNIISARVKRLAKENPELAKAAQQLLQSFLSQSE